MITGANMCRLPAHAADGDGHGVDRRVVAVSQHLERDLTQAGRRLLVRDDRQEDVAERAVETGRPERRPEAGPLAKAGSL